jgi:hypothetical protein
MPEIINQEQQTQSHRVYLNIIYNGVAEIEAPSGRWPHSQGNPLYISYCWDDSINTHPEWHAAFWDAREDWDNLNTPINFYYDANSQNKFGVVNDKNEDPGYTQWWIQGEKIIKAEAYGNQYWDNHWSFTVSQRRGTAAHEIGHYQGVGHIPRGDVTEYNPHEAIMWDAIMVHEKEWLYSPRPYDSALINQVYP